MRYLKNLSLPLTAAIWLVAGAASAQEPTFLYGVGVQPSFSTGDYGQGDDVNVFYLPLVLELYPSDRIRASVVVPWVRQSSTQVVSAGGEFYRIMDRNIRANRKAFPRGMHISRDAAEARDSASGLGDILLQGEYLLVPETDTAPAVRLSAEIKLPTASESKGLGTGEADGGLAVEVGRTVDRQYYYGRLGYTVVGEPSGADFTNPFSYEVGTSFEASPRLLVHLALQGRTSIDDRVDDPLELVGGGEYRLRRDLSLNGYLGLGLSDGSPDVGLGVGLLRRF